MQGGAGFTLGAPFKAAYPFGFGLDYLQVAIGPSAAVVDPVAMFVNVSVSLTNAAPRAGKYVVEVYFSQALSRYARFQRMLGGFAKVDVPAGPGGKAAATVAIPFADMAHWDPVAQNMFLEAGGYTISVCESSAAESCDAGNTHTITIPTTVTGL